MNSRFAIFFLVFFPLSVHGSEFYCKDAGVFLELPGTWVHDTKDTFGCVLRPNSDKNRKIRIHDLNQKAKGPLEASRLANEKANKGRPDTDGRFQRIAEEKSVITKSGIIGCRSTIGRPAYLNRYFFQRPDGSFFCVCVYFLEDKQFAVQAENLILQTLRLGNEKS